MKKSQLHFVRISRSICDKNDSSDILLCNKYCELLRVYRENSKVRKSTATRNNFVQVFKTIFIKIYILNSKQSKIITYILIYRRIKMKIYFFLSLLFLSRNIIINTFLRIVCIIMNSLFNGKEINQDKHDQDR